MNSDKPAEEGFFEALSLIADGRFEDAEARLRQSLTLAPDFAEAHANLAWLLERRGAVEEAEQAYRYAITLNPHNARMHLNLGALLADRKRFAEAEAAYAQALRIAPETPSAWSNLGALYAGLRRDDDAERCHRTALALDANHAQARFNLAYLLLRQGRFEEGWACFESRQWYAALESRIACPRWRGEPLAGRSLLIAFEAGHGDMIQFCRYAALLKMNGAGRIGLVCHPALKRLFATLDGIDVLASFDDPIDTEAWDFWTTPLSLPYHCGTRLESIPAPLPYLRAEPALVAQWAAQLPADGFRVGLVWKGNPRFENDDQRSLPSLDTLAPLARVAAARYVSLQKGAGEDEAQCPPGQLRMVHLGTLIEDFSDTAAIIAGLDVVISVDTAVAHLAGAMAKECWVLIPDYKTDWRWLDRRTDSPWYPGAVRLFRQRRMGDWMSVVASVATALEERVAGNRQRS